MALKTILVSLTTTRDGARVRFPAKSVVDLTDDEQATLQSLQNTTGKLHFREPVNEGGKIVESKPQVISGGGNAAEYEGSKVAIGDKSVAQLKAYLDHFKVEYTNSAAKADLVTLAETHAAAVGDDDKDDQDAGL